MTDRAWHCDACMQALVELREDGKIDVKLGVILHAIHRSEERIMGALEDLQAADTQLAASDANLAQKVVDLAKEQSVFLADIADRLANAPDPAAVQQVADDLRTKATDLDQQSQAVQQLIDQQTAADPGPTTPPAEPAPASAPEQPAPDQPVDQPSVDMTNATGNASSTPA